MPCARTALALGCLVPACGLGSGDGPASDATTGTDASAGRDLDIAADGAAADRPSWWTGPCLVGLVSDEDDNLDVARPALEGLSDVGVDAHARNAEERHTKDPTLLGVYDVVIFYNRNRAIDEAERAALDAYLQGGGRLLVTGHDSLGDPDDERLASVVRSQTVGDLVGPTDFFITFEDHPIATGPAGTIGADKTLRARSDDHDAARPAEGAVAVASLQSGHAKILAAEGIGDDGRVVYWNGNGSSDDGRAVDWSPDAPEELRTLLRNAVLWLCERVR